MSLPTRKICLNKLDLILSLLHRLTFIMAKTSFLRADVDFLIPIFENIKYI